MYNKTIYIESVTIPDSSPISKTWLGQLWARHCTSLAPYNKCVSGRKYLRSNRVKNFELYNNVLSSCVSDSTSEEKTTYEVKIEFNPIENINKIENVTNYIKSISDFGKGNINEKLKILFEENYYDLLPNNNHVIATCDCVDYEINNQEGVFCKHIMATLFSISKVLDSYPDTIFSIRNIDSSVFLFGIKEIKNNADEHTPSIINDYSLIQDDDLGKVFGLKLNNIEITEENELRFYNDLYNKINEYKSDILYKIDMDKLDRNLLKNENEKITEKTQNKEKSEIIQKKEEGFNNINQAKEQMGVQFQDDDLINNVTNFILKYANPGVYYTQIYSKYKKDFNMFRIDTIKDVKSEVDNYVDDSYYKTQNFISIFKTEDEIINSIKERIKISNNNINIDNIYDIYPGIDYRILNEIMGYGFLNYRIKELNNDKNRKHMNFVKSKKNNTLSQNDNNKYNSTVSNLNLVEKTILVLLYRNFNRIEIAEYLNISTKTLSPIINFLKKKLEVENDEELYILSKKIVESNSLLKKMLG